APASALRESPRVRVPAGAVQWQAKDRTRNAADAPAGLPSVVAVPGVSSQSLLLHSWEIAAVGIANGAFSSECLPSPNGDIDVNRIQFHSQAQPADLFGGDQRGSTAQKRIVDGFTPSDVILDRPPHAFDRLLRTMSRQSIFRLALSALCQSIADPPQSRLSAIALPDGRARFTYRIPAGLVLHVIVPTADNKMRFSPDDLTPDLKPTGFE